MVSKPGSWDCRDIQVQGAARREMAKGIAHQAVMRVLGSQGVSDAVRRRGT